jgi:hypothetical protein
MSETLEHRINEELAQRFVRLLSRLRERIAPARGRP